MHADRLKHLAARARAAADAGDRGTAAAEWRAALELLPPGTRQHEAVESQLAALAGAPEGLPAASPPTDAPRQSWLKRGWVALVAAGVFVLGKLKLLLVGLTKWKTLLTMLAFIGVYVQLWGWKFALGFVLGIYIHEMGHVAALRHYGIEATAPMFIPGLGAFVRLKQQLTDVRQDARVGLAGPLWGLGAGLIAYGIGLATGATIWLAIAQATAFINLFNLMPFWQLDGGRGFHALTREQRWVAALAVGGVWVVAHQGLLLLLLILAVVQAFRPAAPRADHGALATYAGLVVALTWLMSIPVTGMP